MRVDNYLGRLRQPLLEKIHMYKTITTPRGVIVIRQAQESDAQAYRELRLEELRNHPDAFSADYAINEARPETFWARENNIPS